MPARVCLIYPPACDPRAPQLALPSLAAALRPAGVVTELVDLNLDSLEALLVPERLRAAAATLEQRGASDLKTAVGRLLWVADEVVAGMPAALEALRGPRFFDADDYNSARDLLSWGTRLISAAAPRPLSYAVTASRYDVDGCDPARLRDLLAVTADPGANVFHGLWAERTLPALLARSPDLVGITITNSQQILPGLMLARMLRERDAYVVIGGAVFTKFVDSLSQLPEFFRVFADGVVVYEGETALLALCEELTGKRDFSRVPNFIHLQGDRVVANRTHLENVAELPTPDFDGLPLGRYLAPAPVLPILTGKGCYFNRCKFCDIPYINHISPKNYRVRAPETIVADVRKLSAKYGAHHFVITDEALSPRLLTKLADAFDAYPNERRNFTGYARLEPGFTAPVLARVAAMGMRKIFFGLESASQKTLDHMDKGTKVAEAPEILANVANAGMAFHLFSIVGFPEESRADAEETLRFFEENTAIIDRPGNTFDIHPFSLDLRTAYWNERTTQGIAPRPGVLDREFVLGLAGSEWQNEHGLPRDAVTDLIYGEFLPRLRRVYQRWHNTHGQLMPGFEEYAVITLEHFAAHAFPHRTCLPPAAEAEAIRLRLNPACGVIVEGENATVFNQHFTFEIDRELAAFLASAQVVPVAQLFSGGSSEATAKLQRALTEMIEAGVLQVRLEGLSAPAAAPSR